MLKNKKLISIIVVCIVFMTLLYALPPKIFGKTMLVKRTISDSEVHSRRDISHAMNVVERSFRWNFKGCTLTELWYDEDESLKESAECSKQYDGAEDVIVLKSNFKVAKVGASPVFNPGDTYKNYEWILVRYSKGGRWVLKEQGYC